MSDLISLLNDFRILIKRKFCIPRWWPQLEWNQMKNQPIITVFFSVSDCASFVTFFICVSNLPNRSPSYQLLDTTSLMHYFVAASFWGVFAEHKWHLLQDRSHRDPSNAELYVFSHNFYCLLKQDSWLFWQFHRHYSWRIGMSVQKRYASSETIIDSVCRWLHDDLIHKRTTTKDMEGNVQVKTEEPKAKWKKKWMMVSTEKHSLALFVAKQKVWSTIILVQSLIVNRSLIQRMPVAFIYVFVNLMCFYRE